MAKRRKKKRSWSFPRISLPAISRKGLHHTLVATLMIALVAGLVAAWIVVVPKLQAYASDIIEVGEIEITFVDRPAWVQDEIEAQLIDAILDNSYADPFTRSHERAGGYLTDVRDALLATGWFERIDQVRRTTAEHIVINATFVVPFAVIREADGADYLVDVRGRLLPWSVPAGTAEQFIAIAGNRFPRPYRPNVQWEGADIAAAIELLKLIEQQQWREQVKVIDVTGYLRGEQMSLITDRGTRIVWGSPPGEEKPLEALVERKLAFLNHHYEKYRHIDAGHTGEIDITSHQAVFQR